MGTLQIALNTPQQGPPTLKLGIKITGKTGRSFKSALSKGLNRLFIQPFGLPFQHGGVNSLFPLALGVGFKPFDNLLVREVFDGGF